MPRILDWLLGRREPAMETKAAPAAGALYPSGSAGGMPIAGPVAFPGWPDRTGRTQLTDEVRARQAVVSSWLFSDLTAIGRELSVAELCIKQQVGEDLEDVEQHALERLWKRPNPFMGASFVRQYWLWQLLLFGEAYLYFAPAIPTDEVAGDDELGDPVALDIAEIWPIPSAYISPRPHPERFIDGYEFRAPNSQQVTVIHPEYICYTRLPNPFDPRRGLSPLAALFTAVETDQAQQRWNRDFFGKRNAVPSGLAILPAHTLPADFERIKAEIFEFFGGGRREIAVTRAGDLDFKMLGVSQRDLDFIEGRKFTREEIDRTLGIPAGYWTAEATEANARHAKGVVIENVVWPLLVQLAEDMTAQILPHWFSREQEAAFVDIRPRDIELKLRQVESEKQYKTIGELRADAGLEPLGDDRDKLLLVQVDKTSGGIQKEPAPAAPAADRLLPAAADTLGDEHLDDLDQAARDSTQDLIDVSTAQGADDTAPFDATASIKHAGHDQADHAGGRGARIQPVSPIGIRLHHSAQAYRERRGPDDAFGLAMRAAQLSEADTPEYAHVIRQPGFQAKLAAYQANPQSMETARPVAEHVLRWHGPTDGSTFKTLSWIEDAEVLRLADQLIEEADDAAAAD